MKTRNRREPNRWQHRLNRYLPSSFFFARRISVGEVSVTRITCVQPRAVENTGVVCPLVWEICSCPESSWLCGFGSWFSFSRFSLLSWARFVALTPLLTCSLSSLFETSRNRRCWCPAYVQRGTITSFSFGMASNVALSILR